MKFLRFRIFDLIFEIILMYFFFIFSTTNVSGDVSVYGGGRKPPYAGDGSNGTSREPPTDDPDRLRDYPQPGYPQYQVFGTKTTRKETHCEGNYIILSKV